jgi:DNA processing protein
MYKINKVVSDEQKYLQMTRGIAKLPKSLYLIGKLPPEARPSVAIIGTRKPSVYGQEVAYKLAYDLAKRGMVVVSGLALGIDAIAHRGALDAGGVTIAVMPGGLDEFYPHTNHKLAERIVASGGALVSEYPAGERPFKANFVARNRIVAAIADGVLVIEAATKSGTLHTAGFALDYGRPVMAVPGNITNPMSTGTNRLIATGARLITSAAEVLAEIGVTTEPTQITLPLGDTPEETALIKLLARGVRDGEELQHLSGITPSAYSQAMTMLEIKGVVRPLGANQWGITWA